MSRTIENDAVACFSSNLDGAYEAISSALDFSHVDDLLEIEILGKSHQLEEDTYVLTDGSALAVSKIGLVQAFLVGRQVLSKSSYNAPEQKSSSDEQILSATAVLLLMDPEHLTAANSRKRLIQQQAERIGAGAADRIKTELRFVDSLLTSPLHRHTKSPTLWSHRRWLVSLYCSLGLPLDVVADVVNVVAVAGQRHPRNYTAWSHARWLVEMEAPASAYEELIPPIKEWCFRHHADISGWSFLQYLLLSGREQPTTGRPSPPSDVLGEVLRLAMSLRWTNESVWVFLRTLAASDAVTEAGYLNFNKTGKDLKTLAQRPSDRETMQTALDWCQTNRLARPREF